MLPVDHPGRPQNTARFFVIEGLPCLVMPGLREIAEAQHFAGVGMDQVIIARHIGSCAQEIHRCLTVSGVILVFLQQASRRNSLPLPFLI